MPNMYENVRKIIVIIMKNRCMNTNINYIKIVKIQFAKMVKGVSMR